MEMRQSNNGLRAVRVFEGVQKRGDRMSEELKCCPFCGELPRTEVEVTKMGGGEDHVDFSVHCTNCGTSKTVRLKINGFVYFFDVEKAQEQVIQAWNQRAVTE